MQYDIITNDQHYPQVVNNTDILRISTQYIEHIKHHKTVSTVRTYSKKLKVFVEWLTAADIIGSMKDQLEQYRSYIDERYTTAKSKNIMLSVVRSFYKWLFEEEIIDHNPTAALKNFTDNAGHSKAALDKYQLHDLFEFLRMDTKAAAPRNRAMIVLALQNGLRVNELANIKIEDFDTRDGDRIIWLLRKGYQDKSAYTILTPETYTLLSDFIKGRTSGYLFNSSRGGGMSSDSISRIIKTTFRRVGIDSKHITAHSLRHSAAVEAYKQGATVYEIMTMLNHKNISTTQIYINSLNRHENSAEKKVNFAF